MRRMAGKIKFAAEKPIATNDSYWGWEYDANDRKATVYLEDSGKLRLEIIETHTKTGLGAGTRQTTLENMEIGTVDKPKLSLAISLLKKHAHDKTSAGRGFKKLWRDENKKERSLGDIIKDYAGGSSKTKEPELTEDEKRSKIMEVLKNKSTEELSKILETIK